jgi:hypothetical protein
VTATAASLTADRRLVAQHEIGHAIASVQLGWSVGRVTAKRHGNVAGSCTSAPPTGRSPLQALLEEACVRIAGPLACSTASDQQADVNRFQEIIAEIALDDTEAEHLRAWLVTRTRALLDRPIARQAATALQGRLEAAGFELDLGCSGRAESQPSIAFAPTININMPELVPAVNVTLEQPDKTIEFERDPSGNLVAATSTSTEAAA